MITLAIDFGMGMTKFLYEHKKKLVEDCFESRLKRGQGDVSSGVLVNGERITFGEGISCVEYGHLGKEHELHRLLMYKAMHKCYEKTGETKFRLAVACSLSSWISDKGEATRNEMFSQKKVNWNNEVEFEIEEVLVFPETLTGALTTDLKLKEEDIMVIDIGTRNLQILRIVQGVPKVSESKSLEIGMDYIYNNISNIIKVKHSQFKDLFAVKRYLEVTSEEALNDEKRYTDLEIDENIKQILLDSIFTVIEKPMNDMGRNTFTKILFLGGGSAYLKRFLHNFFKEEEMNFVANLFYANARGLYKKAKQVYDTKDKQKQLLAVGGN